jgi:hypothetical protein
MVAWYEVIFSDLLYSPKTIHSGGNMFALTGILYSLLAGRTAYLDPGSGSMLLQLLLAVLLGLGVLLRVYWEKIKVLFGGKKADDDEDEKDE